MKAWAITGVVDLRGGGAPVHLMELPDPVPGPGELLLRVHACGICHTELDEIEGRTPPPRYPMVPGHQVVGMVIGTGDGVHGSWMGRRAGVAWINSTCGECTYCKEGLENLCPHFRATGRDVHGGYAERMTVRADFAHVLPPGIPDEAAAPLLCAGAIGYHSLRLTELQDGQVLGLTGFGASGHQVLQLARALFPASPVFVFARREAERELARSLGAAWAGGTDEAPPLLCHAIIDTTPAWTPVVRALGALAPNGRLVINAIRKENDDQEALLRLDYPRHLWMEKEVKSAANITRKDVREFLALAEHHRLLPTYRTYAFEQAPQALLDLAAGRGTEAGVLLCG